MKSQEGIWSHHFLKVNQIVSKIPVTLMDKCHVWKEINRVESVMNN